MRNKVLFIIVLMMVFIPLKVNAIDYSKPSEDSKYSSYEYVIDEYDVDIVVNENNTFNVTETINFYFNDSKHDIYRTIPLKNKITRIDGTTSENRVEISNLTVDNEYTTSRKNNNYIIKIISADKTITKEETYVIKYTYNAGIDTMKNADELYYNIIGTDWDTVIGNVTFNITMPKEFDDYYLEFSKGKLGFTNNNNVKYTINGNEIIGYYDGIIESGEALTVRCELDDKYFVGAKLVRTPIDYLMFIIPILFLGVAIFLWYKFGRDEKIVETIEFYPPKGLNSLEVGFFYKGNADIQDVTSLLIYLANKGYIKISEIEKSSLILNSKGFKITKLKEYDGNNSNEQMFLKGLFTKEDSSTSSRDVTEVTALDLYDNFYITMSKILSNINNNKNRSKIFAKVSSWQKALLELMIVATFCLITIPLIYNYGEFDKLIIALVFPGVGFVGMCFLLFEQSQTVFVNGRATNFSLSTIIFALVWGGTFGGLAWLVTVLPALQQDLLYSIGYIIGIVCVLGMIICLKFQQKRTPYGMEMLGKISGFKNFLETAEKDKLEAMILENPSYFSNILPYAYVFGVSDKWIKKFKKIALQAPPWYDSPTEFDVTSFEDFIRTTMATAQNVMTSSGSLDEEE